MSINVAKIELALLAATNFIAGFEDDDTQEGIPQLLENLREASEAAHQLAVFQHHGGSNG